jgi:hypothetical protein
VRQFHLRAALDCWRGSTRVVIFSKGGFRTIERAVLLALSQSLWFHVRMDILGAILGVAAHVLQGVILDSIRSGKREAEERDLRMEVARLTQMNEYLRNEAIPQVERRILAEVMLLAAHTKGLTVENERIGLSASFTASQTIQESINNQLSNLRDAVIGRRNELRLTVPLGELIADQRPDGGDRDEPVRWIVPHSQLPPSRPLDPEQELDRLRANVEQRRSNKK